MIDTPTYHLKSDDPTKVDSITFMMYGKFEDLDVDVRLVSDGSWYDCQVTHSGNMTSVNCSTKGGIQLSIAEMDEFSVRVVQ